MMLALTLLLAPIQEAPALAPGADEELLVIAEKAGKLKFRAGKDRETGKIVCDITRSSGDAALDDRVCQAMLVCMPDPLPAKPDEKAILACYEPRFRAVVTEWKNARRAAAAAAIRTETHAQN